MKIGIIGTGIMASYMVRGFCQNQCEHSFLLSPRNVQKSAYLASKYENVEVAADNQEVLDQSEVIILSVLPQNAEEILSQLRFRTEHKVISVIPILGLQKIREIIGETQVLVDVLPLPFIAQRMGPIVQYPAQKEIEALLQPLGNLIVVDTEREMAVLRSATALMSPYYELIYHIVEWGMEKQVSETAVKSYVTSFFGALSVLASQTEEGKLKELAEEMTPGGLNWQATNYLSEHSAFEKWQEALELILKRVEGTA